jgi:hypothetical protein
MHLDLGGYLLVGERAGVGERGPQTTPGTERGEQHP